MNTYRVYYDPYPSTSIDADYYKIDDGIVTFYQKISEGVFNTMVHSKVGSFRHWDRVEKKVT